MNPKSLLSSINSYYAKKRDQYKSIDIDIAKVRQNCDSKVNDTQEKYDAKIQMLNIKRDKILELYRIAKDNTTAVLHIDKFRYREPDISLLSDMVYKINGQDFSDPTAMKMVELSGLYISYIDNQRDLLLEEERQQINEIEKITNKSISQLESMKKQILLDCSDYLHSDEVTNLKKQIDSVEYNYGFERNFSFEQKLDNTDILIGFTLRHILFPKTIFSEASAIFGDYFDSGFLKCPCYINLRDCKTIQVEYFIGNAQNVYDGVRGLFINLLRFTSSSLLNLTLLDCINFSSFLLGDISSYAGLKGSMIDKPIRNDGDFRLVTGKLVDYYQKVEKRIGNKTVFEYNNSGVVDEYIPYRLLVINGKGNEYKYLTPELSYLINNSHKLGIVVVALNCITDFEHKNSNAWNKRDNTIHSIRLIDENNKTYLVEGDKPLPFSWNSAPVTMPSLFHDIFEKVVVRQSKGPDYFSYFKPSLPQRSVGKRKPLVVPFARDENDNIIRCSFENENFAAYMMGAAGSGKSTLLHTMICSIVSNYHPDEVELWLIDFKRTEFRVYADNRPPHVKYLLLEESEDLIFDLIDELTSELERRQKVFSGRWDKQTDVPVDEYMPIIFVIIDEFAQVSLKIHASKYTNGTNYEQALDKLIQEGRSFGFKFLFASQTYSTGVEGLSETARKSVQMRFALKNTSREIKDTLSLDSNLITEQIMNLISNINVYETLFRRIDEDSGVTVVNKYYNLKVGKDELINTINWLNSQLNISEKASNDREYIDKKPVLLIDDKPKTFRSLSQDYREFAEMIKQKSCSYDVDMDDIIIHPGVPRSFKIIKPIILKKENCQNLLVVGGERDLQTNLLLSILNSWIKTDSGLNNIVIWTNEQYPVFKKYKERFERIKCFSDIEDIINNSDLISNDIKNRRNQMDKLIICLGLNAIYDDCDDYKDIDKKTRISKGKERENGSRVDLFALMNDPNFSMEKVSEYNNEVKKSDEIETIELSDFKENVDYILRKGPRQGVHFVAFFMKPHDYKASRISSELFEHKIVFPMSRWESKEIAEVDSSELKEGTFIYSNGLRNNKMSTHIYEGIPCNGWKLEEGKIIHI